MDVVLCLLPRVASPPCCPLALQSLAVLNEMRNAGLLYVSRPLLLFMVVDIVGHRERQPEDTRLSTMVV